MHVQPMHKTVLSFIAKAIITVVLVFTTTIILVNILK